MKPDVSRIGLLEIMQLVKGPTSIFTFGRLLKEREREERKEKRDTMFPLLYHFSILGGKNYFDTSAKNYILKRVSAFPVSNEEYFYEVRS